MENGSNSPPIKDEPSDQEPPQSQTLKPEENDSSDSDSSNPDLGLDSHNWYFRNGIDSIIAQSSHFLSRHRDDSESESISDENVDYQCKICRQRCLDEFELEQHFKERRLGDKMYKCCGCEKIFRDNTQLGVHARKHTGERPYSCDLCGKRFSVNGNLNKHMRIHTGEKRFECDTCERKFTQFAHLEDHMKIHSGDRPFVCDFCNSSFKTKARMRKHRKSHESDKITNRSIPCPVCCKLMKSSKQLVSHIETHDESPEKLFPCEFCGKSYKHLISLKYHMRAHGNVKDYKCDLCDKAFTNTSHLRRHMNSHTGVRPYNCEICDRGFPSAQNLKRHTMTHTGEKPYSCDLCGRSFLTLENLNRHKRTHTGEKPFPCEICGKFFAHSTTAKEHLRIHTGAKPFACTLCNKRFSLNKALYRHVREKHPDHFSEFKRLNDLPPNQKRAREKIKIESMRFDADIPEIIPKIEKDEEIGNLVVNPLRLHGDGLLVPKVERMEHCNGVPLVKREEDEGMTNKLLRKALRLHSKNSGGLLVPKLEKTDRGQNGVIAALETKRKVIVCPKVERTDDLVVNPLRLHDRANGVPKMNCSVKTNCIFGGGNQSVNISGVDSEDTKGDIPFIKVEKPEYDDS